MEMTTCSVCGKIFGTSAGAICPACHKLLDMVYEKARAYLRDHPKANIKARELAKAIGEDARLVEILMLEGMFDSKDDGCPEESAEDRKRKQLLEELQKNLSVPSKKDSAVTTYGSDRHGVGRDR